jgi:hypothetical protein
MPIKPRKTHHIDKRAHALVTPASEDKSDDLLTSQELAAWLGVSRQWVEIGRSQGYGPKYVEVAPHSIRYRRDDVNKWLNARTYSCTADRKRRVEA